VGFFSVCHGQHVGQATEGRHIFACCSAADIAVVTQIPLIISAELSDSECSLYTFMGFVSHRQVKLIVEFCQWAQLLNNCLYFVTNAKLESAVYVTVSFCATYSSL